jgi:MOSC domain-containing protein YiiM
MPDIIRTDAPTIVAVARSAGHDFSKQPVDRITLVADLGVEGDAHAGITVQHRSRVARDPRQPNLRQVHLLQAELLADLEAAGYTVVPGDLGENITTRGIDLLALPAGARLHLGASAVVELTGLRNPCAQIDAFRTGLLSAVVGKLPDGQIVRKTGVMSVVRAGGEVRPGDPIRVEWPGPPHRPLDVV